MGRSLIPHWLALVSLAALAPRPITGPVSAAFAPAIFFDDNHCLPYSAIWQWNTRTGQVARTDTAERDSLDARGTAVLQEAVARLGGRDHLRQLDDWVVAGTGRENTSAEWQGIDPPHATMRPHREVIAVAESRTSWERHTPRNDQSLRWRREVITTDSSGMVDHVSGRASMTPNPSTGANAEGLRRRIPHVLLAQLADLPARSLPARGDTIDRVQVQLAAGDTLHLGFGRRSRLLSTVDYFTVLPGAGRVKVSWAFQRWVRDTLLQWRPSAHRITIDGRTFQEIRYTRYQAGAADARELTQPTSLQHSSSSALSFPATGPSLGEVAPRTHLLDAGGFRVMVVVRDSDLVLVETPESHPGFEGIPARGTANVGRAGVALREQLRTIGQGLPLRHIILSHPHDDHIGSLASLVTDSSQVYVAPSHRRPTQYALAHPHDNSPVSRARIVTVADRIVLRGEPEVHVINTGASPHSRENLITWLPASGVLFQGDLFYFEPGGLFPPPGRATMNTFFANWLAQRGIAPQRVYGVHQRSPAGPDALAAARAGRPRQ